MMEDVVLTNEVNVLVVSLTHVPGSDKARVGLTYRWQEPTGGMVDESRRIEFEGMRDRTELHAWLRTALGEVLLNL